LDQFSLLLIKDFLAMSMKALVAAFICSDWWLHNYILPCFSLFWHSEWGRCFSSLL